MALRNGGADGILKAIESGYTATCVYSSGLQVSGTFQEMKISREVPVYIKTEGPTQLCFKDKQLPGHGKEYHSHGFSSPAGKLKNIDQPLEFMSDGDLQEIGLKTGEISKLEFESGVVVEGRLDHLTREEGKILLMSFSGCKVTFRDKILFDPSWGIYDMAVGEKIISAYSGPADPFAFQLEYPVPKEKTHKIVHSERAQRLHHLYQAVRDFREKKINKLEFDLIWSELKNSYPEEWLLPLEIIEIIKDLPEHKALAVDINAYLIHLSDGNENLKRLIDNGLHLTN
jgi:phenylalanine-4-hydroxylase